MKIYDKKFMLTHDTPLMNWSYIYKDAGFDGSIPACAQIKTGTYTFPSSTDKYTETLLTLIGTVTMQLNSKLVRNNIPVEDFIGYWKGSLKNHLLIPVYTSVTERLHPRANLQP